MAQTDTDPDYPFLTAADGHLLRDLVHRAFTSLSITPSGSEASPQR